MEASAIQAGPALARPRITLGSPLLRLRSDQQLAALCREGNDDAFRAIHDRYRPRLLAYMRQMLPGRAADVEDALQDVFLRTYVGLRSCNRELALRPWLYRVAHNRCVDELRRPLPAPEQLEPHDWVSDCDPVAVTEQREALRRLVVDIGRLPDQQRSALLMRELSGMAYADVADALDISMPAVKSLLVRARIGLAQALEAREAECVDIRRELAEAHEDGVRPSWMARRHLRDCEGCRACRADMRAQRRQFAALVPTIGPLAVFAKLFGIGSGAGGGTATAAGAGGAGVAGAGGTVTAASGLATVTVGHVATILAAAVVTAGSAVAVQQTVATHGSHHSRHATHQAARAASAGAAKKATMRVPAHIPPRRLARHAQAAPLRHTPPAWTATGSEGRGPTAHAPATRLNNVADVSGTTSSTDATSTTCAPPPPPACTASETTACPASSTSTTSPGTGSTTGTTSTTGTGTTTGTTTGKTTGSTTGTTTGTSTGTTSGSSDSTCSTTAEGTGTQGATQPTGTGQTGTGQTGTGSGTAQPGKLT